MDLFKVIKVSVMEKVKRLFIWFIEKTNNNSIGMWGL